MTTGKPFLELNWKNPTCGQIH